MAGDNAGFLLNVGMLGVDLWSLGGSSFAKRVVKSSLRAEKSLMKVGGKALASKGDDVAKIYNRCDNIGKNMLVNNADAAKGFSDDTLKVCTDKINCFARDTVVSTPSGPRPIGGIQPGDLVLAFDFEIGDWVTREVIERHDSNYYGPLVTVTTDGGPIRATVYHPFWVVQGFDLEERDTPRELAEDEDQGLALAGRWVNSHELRAGDVIIGRDGRELRVRRVEQEYVEAFPVSNLTIEEHHTFAVGNDGVLVHNTSICGDWVKVNESMSARARAYQTQIAGGTDRAFLVNGVKFDGVIDDVLIEAKGPGYSKFVRSGQFRSWYRGADDLVNQAQRQLRAANGFPIRWHVAEAKAAQAIQRLFAERGIMGIDIIHTSVIL